MGHMPISMQLAGDDMISFIEYRPTFVESVSERVVLSYNTMRELLDSPWISELVEEPDFNGFRIEDNYLMVRFGEEEWVLGSIYGHQEGILDPWDWNDNRRYIRKGGIKWERI